ncbi:MAG: glycosyltransferase [Rhodospirillaceae bacterium]
MSDRFNPLDHHLIFAQPEFLTDIESWQEHIPFAFFCIDTLRPRVLVELGAFKGDSYCAFCQAVAATHAGTRCYAVDTWEGDPHAGYFGPEVLAALREHHDPRYGGFSRLVQTTFDEAVGHFPDGSIDLLHIDGLHTYDAVKHDFETWLPKLSDRGVVLFHDTNVRERDFGVWRLWAELAQRYPGFQFAHGNGLGVLAVGPAVPPDFLAFVAEAARANDGVATAFAALGRKVVLAGREARLSKSVAWMSRDIDRARDRISEQDRELDALRRENPKLADQAARLRAALAEREHQLAAILASTSWRVTAPLRGTISTLRGLRRGDPVPGIATVVDAPAPQGAGLPAAAAGGGQAVAPAPMPAASRLRRLAGIGVRQAKALARDPRRAVHLGKRAYAVWQRGGTAALKSSARAWLRRSGPAAAPGVPAWESRVLPTDPATRARMLATIEGFALRPTISIVTPVYNTPTDVLEAAVASVRAQIYPHWELCLCDDGSPEAATRESLARLAATDVRIKLTTAESNGGIAAASNRALATATGEFVGFLDHDDELTDDALFEVVAALNAAPDADVFYSDEDKIDRQRRPSEPFFKPGWSPELFRGVMYVGHFLVVRRALVDTVGGLRSDFDGVQDYDLMLRLSERTGRIRHIAKILYHWRKLPGSIAESTDAKARIEARQAAAVNEHLHRLGRSAEARPHGALPHRVVIAPKTRAHWPRVSIVIPTRDAPEYIGRCLRSIFTVSTYPDFEVVVVDNGTTDPAALKVLGEHPVTIVPYKEPFNFSRANNLGVAAATGQYVVLLNNDTEVVTPDWLQQMVSLCEAPDVGAVGALLLYPDRTVQHAGVVLGVRGTADHVMRGFPSDADGYGGSLVCTREVSAATAACLMLPRALYRDLGGLSEAYRTIYQDVDLCLRIRRGGRRILTTPRAVLIHHESASRGDRYDHFDRALLLDAWKDDLAAGDPYYSPMLSLARADYSFAP